MPLGFDFTDSQLKILKMLLILTFMYHHQADIQAIMKYVGQPLLKTITVSRAKVYIIYKKKGPCKLLLTF